MNPNYQTIAVLVTANAITGADHAKAPEWILYMPAGANKINCSVNGKPAEIEVSVSAESAERLQASLLARRAGPVMPTIDFDHEGKRASGIPTAFKWEDGRGVLMQAGWTPSGNAAVVTKEWNYFSPQFAYDPKSKEVLGLLPTGPIGGLVNDPAFRALGAIMAHYQTLSAGNPAMNPNPNETNPPMKDELIKVLQAAGLLTEAECSATDAPALLTDRLNAMKKAKDEPTTELATAQAKCTSLETELTALKADHATAAIQAAVQAGRIAPKDTATQAFWTAAIVRDGKSAEAALAKVQAAHDVPADGNLPGVQKVTAGSQLTEAQGAAVAAKAQAMTAANKHLGWSAAWQMAEAEVTAAVA